MQLFSIPISLPPDVGIHVLSYISNSFFFIASYPEQYLILFCLSNYQLMNTCCFQFWAVLNNAVKNNDV